MLVLAIVAWTVALAAAATALLRASGERAVRVASEQAIAASEQTFAAMERADVEKLDATLTALSLDRELVDAFERRDLARLSAAAAPVFEALRASHDVTHLYFIEPEPSLRVFLRAHRPALRGDEVRRATLQRAADTLGVGSGLELGQTAFALRVVRPWYGRDGDLVGFVELGEEIDHLLGRMKARTGDEYGLVVEKAFLDERAWASMRAGRRNDWADRPRAVVVNSTLPDGEVPTLDRDASSIPDGGLTLAEEERGDRTFVRGVVPVKDAAGRRVGGLLVRHDITGLREAMHAARRGLLAAALLVSAALGLLSYLLVDRAVLRRADALRRELDGAGSRDER